MYRILIIEDDKALSDGIVLALKGNDYLLQQAFDCHSAKAMMKHNQYSLIILDINLPDGNGFDVLCEIKRNRNIPVIMLTANDLEIDIVKGLELGADDYITKPFSLMVLRARVNTQIRKVSSHKEVIEWEDYRFNFDSMEFYHHNQTIELSKTEQKLLKLLIDNRGTILSRGELVDKIWTNGAEYVDENALSVTIKRLRDKLEDNPSTPQYIKTIYGIGYTWAVR